MKSFMSSYGLHLFPGKKPHLRPNIDGATHPSTDDHDIPGHIHISTHGTHELSDRYPFNKDLNAGNVIGIGAPYRIFVTVLTLLTCVTSVRLPLRTAHAAEYIRPALARGDDLDVLLNTQAIRITLVESVDCPPSFRTVHFATGPDG